MAKSNKLEFPPYKAPKLLCGGHRMTIAAALLGDLRIDKPPKESERYFEVDTNTTVLAYCAWQERPGQSPTCVLLHGLTGDADDSYVRGTAAKLFKLGFNTLRLNARNCANTLNRTPTIYHMGLTRDMREVLRILAEQDGLQRIYFGGFSMGANVSLKLAGEYGYDAPSYVKGVVAVSPPLRIAESSAALRDGPFNRAIYERKFLRDLKELIRTKAELFPENYDASGLPSVRTLRDFDRAYVAPSFGFSDEDDYYKRASCGLWVDHIHLPALVITAADDPLIPSSAIEEWKSRAGPQIKFLITRHGGHVGYLSSEPAANEYYQDTDRYWAENRICQFLLWRESQGDSPSSK